MELLPIDEEKTHEAAEKILSKYRQKRGFANMPVNPAITSAWSDGTAASTAEKEFYAQQFVEQREAGKSYIEFVDRAIESLPRQTHRDLLRARFCDGAESDHPDFTAMDRLDISSSKYFRVKAQALLAVAHYLRCVIVG